MTVEVFWRDHGIDDHERAENYEQHAGNQCHHERAVGAVCLAPPEHSTRALRRV